LKLLEQATKGGEDDEHLQAIRIELGLTSAHASTPTGVSSLSRKLPTSDLSTTPSSFRTVDVSFTYSYTSPFFSLSSYLTHAYLSSLFLPCGLVNGVSVAANGKFFPFFIRNKNLDQV
jgi:hypothetical protein